MNGNQAMLAVALAVLSGFLLGPPAALAQRAAVRGAGAGPAAVPVSPRRATPGVVRVNGSRSGVMRSAPSVASGARHRTDDFGISGGFPLSFQDLLNITPNSGFDWQSVAALNHDLPMKAFIDPVTQIEVAQAERLLRSTGGAFSGAVILGGGGYYYAPPETEEENPAPQQPQPEEGAEQASQRPQVIVLQQAPQQQSAQPSQPSRMEEQPAEQLPEEGDFTLVLRSGKQVEATAFTRANDNIVYITPEGGRSTIPFSDLDAEATVRVNQERGTPLQLSF